MAADPTPDLNAVITSAVQARIEAEVLAALSGDETFGKFVLAALNQQVEVPKPGGSSYDKLRVPWLQAVLSNSIQDATRQAIRKVLEVEAPKLEEAVTAELRKNIKQIAQGLVGAMTESAKSDYSFKIEVTPRGRNY
jgi:hypothetical protein